MYANISIDTQAHTYIYVALYMHMVIYMCV